MNNSTDIIDQWLTKRTSFRHHRDEIVSIFKVAMENTLLPDKSWFGYPATKVSLSIMFGRIYLIGIFDRTIEIIVDADISKEIGFPTRIVGTSKPSGLNLYWVSTSIDNIKELISNDKIWQHYRLASLKVDSSVSIRSERKDWLEGKFLIKDIFNGQQLTLDPKTLDQIFERELKISTNDSKQRRQERLKQANKKPISTIAQTRVFLRNADVVVEVLQRANGVCDYCQKPAPFVKDSDGKGFLEVHHIKPLADNGDDTIDNAVALCPNCHRQAHHGKNTFDIGRLENKYGT